MNDNKIKNRGYNNASGLVYMNCGKNQMVGKIHNTVVYTPSPDFVNNKEIDETVKQMNNKLVDENEDQLNRLYGDKPEVALEEVGILRSVGLPASRISRIQGDVSAKANPASGGKQSQPMKAQEKMLSQNRDLYE
jgi:hypothetical protein